MDAEAEKLGVKIKQGLWTLGAYDLVITADAPNDEALTMFVDVEPWILRDGSYVDPARFFRA